MAGISEWQATASRKHESIDKLVKAHLPATFTKEAVPSPEAARDGTTAIRSLLGESIKTTDSALDGGIASLLKKLASGELKAAEVVTAFVKRAAVAHVLTNCLSEVLFDSAIARAEELDQHLARTGHPVGPLHGLPITLKDQFRVQGAETSLGYVGWLGPTPREDEQSLVVQDLKKLGAVVLCKTNVPTSLMAIETNNNIIGTTVSAHNRLLSSGGSSGGEAALLALGGAMIGFGSDLAASIRLPSSINGVYGLKPSHGRFSYLRVANSMLGQEIINSVIGPIGHSVEDLEFLTRTLLSEQPWLQDPRVLPIPWRQTEGDEVHRLAARRQLTFALFEDDGIVRPHPPVTRVLRETADRLRAAGHKVIPWKPPHHGEAFSMLISFFLHEGGRDIHAAAATSGEPLIPQLSAYYGAEPSLPVKSIQDVWALTKQRDSYQASYLEYWNSTASETGTGRPVDFVIMPCCATPSFEQTKGMYMGYTGVVNILDYAAIAIKGGKVEASTDSRVARDVFYGDMDKTVWEQYDPELFDNTPIGVQVMGRRLQEERVLAAAREIARA